MDTKSKKWKSVVSFAAFVAGVSLALVSGLNLYGTAKRMLRVGDNPFETDYQDTQEFRSYVENRLFNFIAMAAGTRPGYVYGGYGYNDYYDYYDYYGYYDCYDYDDSIYQH